MFSDSKQSNKGKIMNRIKSIILPILGFTILTACGAGKTIIYEPIVLCSPEGNVKVEILRGDNTVQISDAVTEAFERQLQKRLYQDGLVQPGAGLTLKYRFIQYDGGNRVARYVFGGIGNCGEASLTVEVTYFDANGTYLGKIQTEGKISSGLFGGSTASAVEKAAEEVAKYTRSLVLNNS